MFEEYSCGCILSQHQGRVRICGAHRPETATGDGAMKGAWVLRHIVRRYPANGEMPSEWTGR